MHILIHHAFRLVVVLASACLLALAAGAQTKAKTRTYSIVASDSSFWVFVGKAGALSFVAHDHNIGVKSFSGRVTVPESGVSSSALELDIETKSLIVLDKKVSDKDRAEITKSMHGSVLESEKHPKITFRATAVSDVRQNSAESWSLTLSGDLTLHGVTKRISIPVTATITQQQLKASGKYTLRQTDFGITPYSAAGGTIKVKNEVVVNFAIVAKAI
jgi:polyisoprenoid-binding protein YceI